MREKIKFISLFFSFFRFLMRNLYFLGAINVGKIKYDLVNLNRPQEDHIILEALSKEQNKNNDIYILNFKDKNPLMIVIIELNFSLVYYENPKKKIEKKVVKYLLFFIYREDHTIVILKYLIYQCLEFMLF